MEMDGQQAETLDDVAEAVSPSEPIVAEQSEPEAVSSSEPEAVSSSEPEVASEDEVQASSCAGPTCPLTRLFNFIFMIIIIALVIGFGIYALSFLAGSEFNMDSLFHGKKATTFP